MPFRDDIPDAQPISEAETADDRRRLGRLDVSPELVPMLRGRFDRSAPPDPNLPRPPLTAANQEWLSGVLFVAALLLVGVFFRFAV